MMLNVPEPVAAYLAAEEAKDVEKLSLCFIEDGTVYDEGRDYRGRGAIRQWKQEADKKYRYVLLPLNAQTSGNEVMVQARLTGDFAGSPLELNHIFKLKTNKIASLGRLARPGSTAYHAAKWAVGGFTESLAQEVAPFGVKVCALEPGGMRTNWGTRANQDTPELLPDYEPSVGAVAKALKSYWGHETSDPTKVAQVVLRLAASDSLPAHLLLGSDVVQFAGEADATRAKDAERWREISVSTDVTSAQSLPALRF